MCWSSWITITVCVLEALRTGHRPRARSSTLVQTQRFIVSARRSRGRKWLMKRYLFGEAEAAHGSVLNGTDGAEKATTPPVPEPRATGGATAVQKRSAGARRTFWGAPLTTTKMEEVVQPLERPHQKVIVCVFERNIRDWKKSLAQNADEPASTLARRFTSGTRMTEGTSIITGNKTVTAY